MFKEEYSKAHNQPEIYTNIELIAKANCFEMKPLNLFYEEPESDRWLPLDRYPRRVIRRIVRGKPRMGGHKRVFLNLCTGLDRLGISYYLNNYHYIQKHPEAVACIIGKPHVLHKLQWKNPIVLGTAIFSHPCDDPQILDRLPICKILVPGEWVQKMWEPYYGDKVIAWPVGIDTEGWMPALPESKDIDILLYDKILWGYEEQKAQLVTPILSHLSDQGLQVAVLRYGSYQEQEFHTLLKRSKAMIFLCEHETQGIAYQQALSSGVPILAWDQGGFWPDPSYFPHKVKFAPVTSVPYWDERCGLKFKDIKEFPIKLEEFQEKLRNRQFAPRDYILDNLTLEKCARRYLEILKEA